MDGPAEFGGANAGAGPGPLELMLLGVGGCASFAVVRILRKGRQDVTDCVAEVEAERARANPEVFTRIHLRFRLAGRALNADKVARAVRLAAQKYCPASVMLARGGVAITHDYELVDS